MTREKSWEEHLMAAYRGKSPEPAGFVESARKAIQLANSGSTAEAVDNGRRAISISPDDPRGYAALAYALWVQEDNEGAVKAADSALKLSKGDQLVQLVRSAALTNLGLHDAAADAAFAALKQWPNDPTVIRAAAAAAVNAKRYLAAVEAATKLLKAKPDDTDGHHVLGLALSGLSRVQEAESAYRAGLVNAPDDPQLLNGLGFTLVLMSKSGEAETYLRRSLRKKETWYTYGSLAACLIGLADAFKDDDLYREVISTIDSALVLLAGAKPDADEHGRLYLQRGYAHARLRDFGNAKLDFKNALVTARPQSSVSLMAGRNLRRINVTSAKTPDLPHWLTPALAGAAALVALYSGIALWSGHLDQNAFLELVIVSLVVIIAAYTLPNLTKIRLGTVELEKQIGVVRDVPLEVLHVG